MSPQSSGLPCLDVMHALGLCTKVEFPKLMNDEFLRRFLLIVTNEINGDECVLIVSYFPVTAVSAENRWCAASRLLGLYSFSFRKFSLFESIILSIFSFLLSVRESAASEASETNTTSFFRGSLGTGGTCLTDVVGVFGLGDCWDITSMLGWCAYDVLGDTDGETLVVGLVSTPVRAPPAADVVLDVFIRSWGVSQHHEARMPLDMRAW